jgi:Holliday junction resolvase RusA-like endonuclease
MLVVTIPGIPIPWKGPVVTKRGCFSPRYKEMKIVREIVKEQYSGEVCVDAVWCSFLFVMPIPSGTSQKKRKDMLAERILPTKRPDRTNMAKFYEDCLNGIVYADDSQIVDGPVSKVYGEDPKTVIAIVNLVNEKFFKPEGELSRVVRRRLD